jgi:hypothetical protein
MNTKNRANCREMHDRFLLQLHLEERGGEREREKERGRRRERERERGERERDREKKGGKDDKERKRTSVQSVELLLQI